MNEEQIRKLRTWRTTAIAITIIEAGLLIAHSFASASWPGTLILGIITLACTVAAVRNTGKLRAAKAVQPRVDWTSVRIMEHEVYGRIFRHDGAPGLSGTTPEAPARQDSTARAVWCDCHGTIPGHIRAPRHYDPRYGYPPEDAPVVNSPDAASGDGDIRLSGSGAATWDGQFGSAISSGSSRLTVKGTAERVSASGSSRMVVRGLVGDASASGHAIIDIHGKLAGPAQASGAAVIRLNGNVVARGPGA